MPGGGEEVLGSLPTPETIENYLREEWLCDDKTCSCHTTGEMPEDCCSGTPTVFSLDQDEDGNITGMSLVSRGGEGGDGCSKGSLTEPDAS